MKTAKGLNAQRRAAASLTDEEVRRVRVQLADGDKTVRELADWHGVGHETIRKIGRRETYAWVTDVEVTRDEMKEAERAALRLSGEEKARLEASARRVFEMQEKLKEEGKLPRTEGGGGMIPAFDE